MGLLAAAVFADQSVRQTASTSIARRRMLVTFLAGITAARRAGAIALLWLLVLTILNVHTGGALRSTILFAIPVALVAWTSWQHGFLFAAIAVIAARYGGAMPEPGATSPLWLDGLLAFLKLSIDAVVVNAWGRRQRRRAERSGDRGSDGDETLSNRRR